MIRSVMVLAAMTVLGACSNYADAPQAAPLQQLAAHPHQFDGMTVTTAGVLRRYPEPLHYWIEDPQLHRVELHPKARVRDYLGQRIRVFGTFHFTPDRGRWIQVDKVARAP